MKDHEKIDDHHCNVIERKRLKKELAACDTKHSSQKEIHECHDTIRQFSKKREWACKFS